MADADRQPAIGGRPRLAAATSGGADRTFGLGPSRPRRTGLIALAIVVVAIGIAAAATGGRAGSGRSDARYGGIPQWLPRAVIPVGRVVTASSAHPALAVQGDAVSVLLGGARVLATAVGPTVPEEGRFPVPATSPCSFVITFTHSSGPIALDGGAFTVIDERGAVHRLRVTVVGGGGLPRRIEPGQSVSLDASGVLPTGDGQLRWAPSGRPIVSWDFDVEID
jgi:hypothetical protein